jgi:hypothetical protein
LNPSFYLCTPTHDGKVHVPYHQGCLRATVAFPGRLSVAHRAGPILPRNRDLLTDGFLDSPATHMLCVDSDIGFGPEQILALIETGKPFVSGTYSKKQEVREIPADYTGRTEGSTFETLFSNGKRGQPIERPLWEAKHVPAGFMLIERAVVQRMAGAYRNLQYHVKGIGLITGLWSPTFDEGKSYAGEDVAFCRRWLALGGEIWMHRGVVLDHHGEMAYLPDEADVVPTMSDGSKADAPQTPEQPAAQTNGVTRKMQGTLPVFVHPQAS